MKAIDKRKMYRYNVNHSIKPIKPTSKIGQNKGGKQYE